jgi:hypothetical protein
MQASMTRESEHKERIAELQGGCLMKIVRILFAAVAFAVLAGAVVPAEAAGHHHHHHHHRAR